MNFEDERYVRLYTRDTPRWISWRWETRAVFEELLRKVDRTGRIEWPARVGTKALAETLRIPHRVVAPALDQLAEQDGPDDTPTIVMGAGWLTLTKYVEGQNAKSRAMTGAERTAEWRARQNGGQQRSLPECDDASRGDDERDDVTPSGAVLTQPTQQHHARARGRGRPSPHDAAAARILARLNELRSEGIPGSALTDMSWIVALLRWRPDGERECELVLTDMAAEARRTRDWTHLNPSTPFRPKHFESRIARAQANASKAAPSLTGWTPAGGTTQDELDERLGEDRRRA